MRQALPIGNLNASSHHAAPCRGHPGRPERRPRRRVADPGALTWSRDRPAL